MSPVPPIVGLTYTGSGSCYEQDATDEHDLGTTDADDAGISDVDLEKLMKGLEHGSSRSTSRSGAARRGDLDEVMTVRQLPITSSVFLRYIIWVLKCGATPLCSQLIIMPPFVSVSPEHR